MAHSPISWCVQRIVSIILILVIILNVLALTVSAPDHANAPSRNDHGHPHLEATRKGLFSTVFSQGWFHAIVKRTFVWYCLWIHVAMLVFPWRACYSLRELSACLKKSTLRPMRPKIRTPPLERQPSADSSETSASSSSSRGNSLRRASTPFTEYDADSELDDDHVIHAILIPNYKEDLDGLRETLEVLASHAGARSSYDIYLAMEENEVGSAAKALCLIGEFTKSFRNINFTMHPKGIPGESQGKGSNLKWAARVASESYRQTTYRPNVIVTGMDSDSHLSSEYFAHIHRMHLSYPATASSTFYVPPIVFDRNCQMVSKFVRVADIAWCCAGLSGLYASSRVGPPTSVYSLPLVLADHVGGWDGGPEAIGEDLHMYLKCFVALRGNLTTRTIHAPVSQSNVHGNDQGIRAGVGDCKARYKQGLRHMWGALDSGYFALELWRNMSSRRSVMLSHSSDFDGYAPGPYHRDSPNSSSMGIELDRPLPKPNHVMNTSPLAEDPNLMSQKTKTNYLNILLCLHRLYEAHFVPAQLFVFIISTATYDTLTPYAHRPAEYIWLSNFTGYLRVFGLFSMVCVFLCYERFHTVCVQNRELEMRNAGLYDAMSAGGNLFGRRSLKMNISDYFLFTISGFMFGSVAAIHAQISHFWTLELAYGVSKKPTRVRANHEDIV